MKPSNAFASLPRLLVSAAHKSSGKTTVTLGLCAALRDQGLKVQPFKKGPDYIDPMWLAEAAGAPCFNLDAYLMDEAALMGCFSQAAKGADLCIVEGNKGLYDGLALDGSNSNAALARQLGAPVLLVIDARGMTRGIAPLILGYQAFDPSIRIGGVILNRLGGARHEAKLRAVIEHYTTVPVLGAVAEDPRLALQERHLGLMTCAEVAEGGALRARVQAIGRIIASQVDLAAVRALAGSAAPAPPGAWSARDAAPTVAMAAMAAEPAGAGMATPHGPRLRIGIARDRAFGFYYPDDLSALEAAGAELVPINTLHDTRLPALDGLFIGGGFPETCMQALQDNVAMRHQLRAAIEAGLPTYAECGGLMYLSRCIQWDGRSAQMVGVIPGDSVMHARPIGRGYTHLEETVHMPWAPVGSVVPSSAATDGPGLLRGHEFHHSTLVNLDPTLAFAYRVRRGHGIDGEHDGVLVHNLLASYTHLRSAAGAAWAPRFMDFVRRERRLGIEHAHAEHAERAF